MYQELVTLSPIDVYIQNDFAEALAIDNAFDFLDHKISGKQGFTQAIQIFENLAQQTQRTYYTEKKSIVEKMIQGEVKLESLIIELSMS